MLKTRIITALVVLPVVLIALFRFPAWAWTIFAMAIVLVSLWEWSRFCGWSPNGSRVYMAISVLLTLALAYVAIRMPATFRNLVPVLLSAAAIFWIVVVPLWLLRTWRPKSPALVAMAGWVVIFPFGTALLVLREMGPKVLLAFALVVWVADIAAYFAGKAFGKNKLAPAISPGKTWEGVLGAMLGATLLWAVTFWWVSKKSAWPVTIDMSNAFIPGLVVYFALTAISIFGDLFESWMKRGAGLKDSSNLLPGHGGVLDRVDALTSALPLACAVMLMLK